MEAPDDVVDELAALVRDSPDGRALEAALRSLLGLGGQSPAESTWAIRRLLETLAARGPVIAVLDDLHWASPALIDLVEDAARWTRVGPPPVRRSAGSLGRTAVVGWRDAARDHDHGRSPRG